LPLAAPFSAKCAYNECLNLGVQSRFSPNECLIWVKDAISWLLRFAQFDHHYALPISIRGQLNDDAKWAAGLAAAKWQFNIPLVLSDEDPSNLFPLQRHVRMRGLSGFVVGDTAAGVWQMKVLVPPNSRILHRLGKQEPMDQTQVPPSHLGRVMVREVPHEPDIIGSTTLHNVSPFGVWEVSLKKKLKGGVSIDKLEDVVIDLHLAVREA
jgi:hypothetical protein